jgi:hypothetical protein
MISTDRMTDTELDSFALALLQRELGPDGLARFLKLHGSGFGDYTEERSAWQRDLTVDEIAESIRHRREHQA